MANENIRCFPTELLEKAGVFHGLSLDIPKYCGLLLPEHAQFVPREKAETDPSFKQVIPYVIVIRSDMTILQYQRGKSGGEARLHDKWSIGVGGHINDLDASYERAMVREFREEVGYDGMCVAPMKAFINDDTTEVGKVHFGVVHVVVVKYNFTPRPEAELANLAFVKVDELWPLEKYESWSQFCIKDLHKLFGFPRGT